MELWLRSSQNGNLIKCRALTVYNAKERALEVLDEIQSVIATHIGKKANDCGLDYFGCAVYQMPQK